MIKRADQLVRGDKTSWFGEPMTILKTRSDAGTTWLTFEYDDTGKQETQPIIAEAEMVMR